MPFTPDFDQPGNSEEEDACNASKEFLRKKAANAIINSIDEKLIINKNVNAKKYRIPISGAYDSQIKEIVRAVYIGVGWSEVNFIETDYGGSRDPYTLTTVILFK